MFFSSNKVGNQVVSEILALISENGPFRTHRIEARRWELEETHELLRVWFSLESTWLDICGLCVKLVEKSVGLPSPN